MSRFSVACIALTLVCAGPFPAANSTAVAAGAKFSRQVFRDDLKALTANPHRLAGLEDGSRAAGQYVRRRLERMGFKNDPSSGEAIFLQDFQVVAPLTTECRLFVDGQEVTTADGSPAMYQMRPNLVQAAVTPAGGLSGETVYVGEGQTPDYVADGKIVVFDFDCGKNWQTAFALGAKAVLFIGQDSPAAYPYHHVNIAANFPRFYIPAPVAAQLELTARPRKLKLLAASEWSELPGQNVIAVLRGTGAKFDEQTQDQAFVMAAPLDSLSEVPYLSPGARDAANCAVLLQMAEYFLKNRPRRDVILCFFDAQTLSHMGARTFYGALYRKKVKADHKLGNRLDSLNDNKAHLERIFSILTQPKLFDPNTEKMKYHRDAVRMVRKEADVMDGDVLYRLSVLRVELGNIRDTIKARERLDKLDPAPNADEREALQLDRTITDLQEQARQLEEKVLLLDVHDLIWNRLNRILHKGIDVHNPRQLDEATTDETAGIVAGSELQQLAAAAADVSVDDEAAFAKLFADYGWDDVPARQRRKRDLLKSILLKKNIPAKYDYLINRVKGICRRRLDVELGQNIHQTQQAMVLNGAIGEDRNAIVLHLSINLGDGGDRWAFIDGEHSLPMMLKLQGSYSSLFQAIEKVHKESPPGDVKNFDAITASMIYRSRTRLFSPGLYADSGAVARIFALFCLSAMTTGDRLPRQGQPADTVEALNTDVVLSQAEGVAAFVRRLAGSDDLTVAPRFKYVARFDEVEFSGNKASGPSVNIAGAGDAMVGRPVRNGVVALVPIHPDTMRWTTLAVEKIPAGFSHPITVMTSEDGKYEIPAHSSRHYYNAMVFAVLFDSTDSGPAAQDGSPSSRGLIDAVTSKATIVVAADLSKKAVSLTRVHCVSAAGYGFYRRPTEETKTMRDISATLFRDDRYLACEMGNVIALFAPRSAKGAKLFNSRGMVLLNNTPTKQGYQGKGIALNAPFEHPATPRLTATGLINLHEYRLQLLRNNRIIQESLEVFHSRAMDLKEDAATMSPRQRNGAYAASGGMARQVYEPLVGVMNDLVTAVVLLLLLAMPFAYALERLLVGTPHIYRQIGWFAMMFVLTFIVLYFVNPAFSIAATPIIIFLAFSIILLSSLVIFIMLRKLQTEVRKMQGLAATVHTTDVSRLSTMMAAVNMGISTMRRRPLRTFLTASTVVLLTFTILTFASFGSNWGIRKTYRNSMNSAPPRIIVRQQLWGTVNHGIHEMLRDYLWTEADVVPRYWVAPTAEDAARLQSLRWTFGLMLNNRTAGKLVVMSAAIGIDPADLYDDDGQPRQEQLKDLFADDARLDLLGGEGVFLSDAIRRELGLGAADIGKAKLFMAGHELIYAGVVSDKLASYTILEGSSMLPVDYRATAGDTSMESFNETTSESMAERPEMESAQFVTSNIDEVVIVSPDIARRMGGRVRSITVYPHDEGNVQDLAGRIATITDLPTYVGDFSGVHRMIFTSLAQASGWRDLLIPVILGGLIVFATMLGSVSDRQREIYTFSSLGLAPPHIASLFFAEASVYAVVGGMGGYLLGQIVARLLAWLGGEFHFSVPTMNYSSTNAIVTIMIVMGTVLISTIFPALRASRSANPGIQRSWKIPAPVGDLYDIIFPFTISAYDITGVASFLKEHFNNYSDTSLGIFATSQCHVFRQEGNDMLGIRASVALAPFDLGVNEDFVLMSRPSDIEGIDEVRILIYRLSGAYGDWKRSNRVFINDLRRQLLIWRSLPQEVTEKYRQETLEEWDSLPHERIDENSFGENP